MFQFRAFPSYTYLIQCMIHGYCPCVFPHSEISGSSLICSSPKLIAACHVLHRLLMPRHSPCALISLTWCKRSLHLVLLNYAGFNRSSIYKIVFTLMFKSFHNAVFLCRNPIRDRSALCCLAFLSPLFSFQGASMVENSGIEPLTS